MRRLATVLLFTAVLCGGTSAAAQAATLSGHTARAGVSASAHTAIHTASHAAKGTDAQAAPSAHKNVATAFKRRHIFKSNHHSHSHHSHSHLPKWVEYILIPLIVIGIVAFILVGKLRNN